MYIYVYVGIVLGGVLVGGGGRLYGQPQALHGIVVPILMSILGCFPL